MLIEIIIGEFQELFRVVTIVRLQSLQRRNREKEGYWDGVSSLPESNRSAISPDFRVRRGLGLRTQTV